MKGHTYSKRNNSLKFDSHIDTSMHLVAPYQSNKQGKGKVKAGSDLARKFKSHWPKGTTFRKMIKLGYIGAKVN